MATELVMKSVTIVASDVTWNENKEKMISKWTNVKDVKKSEESRSSDVDDFVMSTQLIGFII